MTVTYQLDFRTRWWATWEAPGSSRTPILWVLMVLVFIAFFQLFSRPDNSPVALSDLAPLVLPLFGAAGLGVVAMLLMTTVKAERLKGSRSDCVATFTEEGFESSFDGASALIPWHAILAVQPRRRNLFLRQQRQWLFVPRSAFASADAFAEAVDFARSRQGQRETAPTTFTPRRNATPSSPYAPPEAPLEDAAAALAEVARQPRADEVVARVAVPPEVIAKLQEPLTFLKLRPQLLLIPVAIALRVHTEGDPRAAAIFMLPLVLFVGIHIGSQYVPWTSRLAMLARTPILLDITESGVRYRGAHERGALDWSKFTRVTETRVAFVFNVAEQTPFFAPKELFQRRSEIDATRDVLRRRLGARAKLL